MSHPIIFLIREECCKDFTFGCHIGVEIRSIQLDCTVKTGGVIHSAFAAAAVCMNTYRPFQQAVSIGIPVGKKPFHIVCQFRGKSGDPFPCRFGFVDQFHCQPENGGLCIRLIERIRTSAQRNKTVFLLQIEHGGNQFPRHCRVIIPHPNGMKRGIPQPHVAVRPTVRRTPMLFDHALCRIHLTFDLRQCFPFGTFCGFRHIFQFRAGFQKCGTFGNQ